MSFSDAWERMILKRLFSIQGYATCPIWVGLSSSDPLDTGSGVSEPKTGKGYTRVKTTTTSGTSWQVSDTTGTTVNNSVEILFPTATKDWGTMAYGVLFSGSTSGASILASGALTASKVIATGDAPKYAASSIQFGIR